MKKSTSKAFIGASIGLWIGLMGAIAFGADKPDKDGFRPLATCADGQTEYSKTGDHRGACGGHGGVAKWADGSPVKSHAKATRYGK